MFGIRQASHAIVRRIGGAISARYLSDATSKSDSSSGASTSWASSETNELVKQLSSRIKAGGPITVAEFMRESLLNPQYGYYTRHEVFGKKGDFITAPEISQIFGELLAVWVMYEHSNNGGKDTQLVELGPGRGTLMKDIVRVSGDALHKDTVVLVKVLRKRKYPDAHTCIALYEASALMRRRQAESLLNRSFDPVIADEYRIPDGNYALRWIDDIRQLHPRTTYFVTNELFDAYPIHKFQKTPQGWKEVMIDWNSSTKRLQYVLSPKHTTMSRLYANLLNSIEDRQHVEISPQSSVMMQAICKHISIHGGSALIGDYGHWGEKEDTFRGFRKHTVVDALSDPGNIDITADVDFEQLALSGNQIGNVHFYGPVSQRNFLYNLGIDVRASALARDKTPTEQKEILSAVEKLVSPEYMDESLAGYVRAHSHLELAGRAVIARSQVPHVAIISGSGAGHEPSTAGFVGRGLLSASISGSIFESPASSDIFRLIVEMKRRGAKQILMIILNYTGDRLNFGLAMERARELSIDTDMLVVADDAAVDSAIGPRGLAGLLLVIKIAGAMAEEGKTMSEIVDVCQTVRGQLRTIGLSASGIRVPGQPQLFELLDDEMELGMGIHGEMGAQKLKLVPVRQATDLAFGQLFRGTRSLHIKRDDTVLLLVNNLGGCSNLEFGVIIKDAIESLEHRALHVKRILCGELMTAFNMKGFSLTILKLTMDISANILSLLDAPTDAFAWPRVISTVQLPSSIQSLSDSLEFSEQFTAQLQINSLDVVLEPAMSDLVQQALQAVVKRLNNEVDKLNRLDSVAGDGDTGTVFGQAADTIAQDLADGRLTLDRPSLLFRRLGLIAESRMGGRCGAICGLFFAAVAKNMSLSIRPDPIIDRLSEAFEAGIRSVESYSRARPGDKSLLDALIPAVDFVKTKRSQQAFTAQDWKEFAAVVERAAQETKNLVAKVGRASYGKLTEATTIDPGAHAVSVIVQAISDVFAKAAAQ